MTLYIAELFMPLILSNVLHMFVVKKDIFSVFKVPIHRKLFGRNKTLRGFIFVAVCTGGFQWIVNELIYSKAGPNIFLQGIFLGFVFMLFELPNSFVKRRFGVAAGERPVRFRYLFLLLDKSDSTLGVCLAFVLIKSLGVNEFLSLFLLAVVTHLSISQILVTFKVKESL